MNTQNDKQEMDRQAFIASYWGQFVLTVFQEDGHHNTGEVSAYSIPFTKKFRSYLELLPLSSITDEHAIEVAKIISGNESERIILRDEYRVLVSCGADEIGVWFDGEILLSENEQYPLPTLECYDKLRELGYLLPFRSYSTQQLIDMGWIKLKTINQ